MCMRPARAMTIRLSAEQAELLDTVATVDDRAISDVIRAAIDQHIAMRRRDPDFRESLKDRLARAQSLLSDE